ncbi:MAG: hypothetical protein CMB96_04760 [Flavobacteriaceae bacterium]|nr:hypothetical protein [Flavobacteriaceae bacterium]|tara:strand:- start:686 stop:1165 length:480 start_codon:yes stop_codon:yes gene_type:complete
METLDLTWFNSQEKIEQKYDDFYLSDIKKIGVTFIYINGNNEICVTRKESVELINSILYRRSLVNLLRENRKLNGVNYSLYALLKFNFISTPEAIINHDLMGDHFKVIANVQDIIFQKSIKQLESVNHLYIVLKPKTNTSHTKRVKITHKRRKTRRAKI